MRRLLILLICLLSLPAAAQTPPVPGHHPVKEMEQKLKEEQQAKESLKKELKKIEIEIESGNKTLVDLAGDIKKNEAELTTLETQLKELQVEKDDIQKRLGVDNNSMADLILALQRIMRVPPEALLARPGAPLQTAQSAMLLHSVLPNIYERAEGLKTDLTRLSESVTKTETDKKALEAKRALLALRQKEMKTMLSDRQKAYKQAEGDVKARDAEIKQISAKAMGLKDLLSRLEEKNRERIREASLTTTSRTRPAPRRDIMPKAGSGQMPVSGIVRVRYGERDDIGAKSEGIRIEARNGALVVSPLGGIVRYSGDFRNYGQMVIIEHPNNYHSLVAGLARIDTVVGQSVAAGEPIGTLGGDKPALYYELRLDGQPINPSRKIGDLG